MKTNRSGHTAIAFTNLKDNSMFHRLQRMAFLAYVFIPFCPANSQDVDLVLHHGRIVTVDDQFSIAQAMAIAGDRIVAVGSDETVLAKKGPNTKLIDLAGKMVLPGLIDSHVHAPDAAIYEFDHVVPEMESIGDVLSYLRSRTQVVPEGEWISVSQVFVTRLKEPRFPTRLELDQVAPKHPIAFRTGPDAALNSMALERSGIGEDFQITDGEPGHLERDPKTGRLNGILRSCSRLIKSQPSGKSPTNDEKAIALKRMLHDYNRVGLTSVSDRNASDLGIELYQALLSKNELSCRVYLYYGINAQEKIETLEDKIPTIGKHPLREYNSMLWLRGVKIFLDGGMLTGSAYMRKPWGKSEIYSITDPDYRGLLYVQEEKLYRISKAVIANELQMTAHSVGDGAIHALIDAYARVNQEISLEGKRPCITHCNFLSAEAIASMKQLGLVADLQPAWLWLDGQTLLNQFGQDRTQYFQPYRSLIDQGVIVGGGSDHMQKVGSFRAVNPYNPFLGMWIAVQRTPRRTDQVFHAEQRISREEAIRLYTINNAYLTFEEKQKGSLEAYKLADFIILDRDILSCPIDDLRSAEVLSTYVGGRMVYQK